MKTCLKGQGHLKVKVKGIQDQGQVKDQSFDVFRL